MKVSKKTSGRAGITVVGVGGCGGNIINSLVETGIEVKTIAINTDSQAIEDSLADVSIVCGEEITNGFGAGADPEVGRDAVQATKDGIYAGLSNTDLLFIVGGMGGGTGTFGVPKVCQFAKELGITTVAVITTPFFFEGSKRSNQAIRGYKEIVEVANTIICIKNQDLIDKFNGRGTKFRDAFKEVDKILINAVSSVVEIISQNAMINIDFADIKTIMRVGGASLIGTGYGSGDNRAHVAAEEAIGGDLISLGTLSSAKAAIVSITGSTDMGFSEVHEAADLIYSKLSDSANIIFGATTDPLMEEGEVKITIIASGVNNEASIEKLDVSSISNIISQVTPINRGNPGGMNDGRELKEQD